MQKMNTMKIWLTYPLSSLDCSPPGSESMYSMEMDNTLSEVSSLELFLFFFNIFKKNTTKKKWRTSLQKTTTQKYKIQSHKLDQSFVETYTNDFLNGTKNVNFLWGDFPQGYVSTNLLWCDWRYYSVQLALS